VANYFTNNNPPQSGGTLKDLTSWMQDNATLGYNNANKYMQDQAKAAQSSMQDSMNYYNTAVQGMQGQYQNLNNQMQQGLGQQQDLYNQAAQVYQTGQVPQQYQDYLQQSRDSMMNSLISDMNKYYQDRGGNMIEQLAGRGILDSTIAANALNQFEAEQQRQLLGQGNQLNAQMFQQLAQAPTQFGNNLTGLAQQYGNSLTQNVGTQGQLGARIPQSIQPLYEMGSGMFDIPATMSEQYRDALTNLWNNLLSSGTQIETANIRSDANDSDSGMGDFVNGLLNVGFSVL
jgi:hypothetical protein